MGYRAENLLRLFKAAAPTLLGIFGVLVLAATAAIYPLFGAVFRELHHRVLVEV